MDMIRNHRARLTALLLALGILLSLAGCAKTVGNYRVLKTFGEESFRIGYRLDDQVAVYIDAALRSLAADGTVHRLAVEWMGQDNTLIEADTKPLKELESIAQKAKFSQHTLSDGELAKLEGYVTESIAACREKPWHKRLVDRYWRILY
jgi:hypothetical protein